MPPKIVHKWTEKNRIILCLLQRKYLRCSVAPLWSEVFRNQLAVEGFRTGMPATRLDGQYQEMKMGGKGYEIYALVNNATDATINENYANYLQEIRQAIRALNLTPKPRSLLPERNQISQLKRRSLRAKRAVSIPVTVDDNDPSDPGNDISSQIQRFAYNRDLNNQSSILISGESEVPEDRNRPISKMPIMLRTNLDKNGNAVSMHPLLLFRATPSISSFRSRKYANPHLKIPPPPQFGSKEYRDWVRPHLQRDEAYPSPLLSLAQSPRNALRRIERTVSASIESKMFLAIFVFNDLCDDAKKLFGEGAGPHLVRSLFNGAEDSGLPDGYQGNGEVSESLTSTPTWLTSIVVKLGCYYLRPCCNS